jgi:hypothetical protein
LGLKLLGHFDAAGIVAGWGDGGIAPALRE